MNACGLVTPTILLTTADFSCRLQAKSQTDFASSSGVEGYRGTGDREKRGLEVYGRREKREREAEFPKWREAGEKGKNYATLHNISQSKKCKKREPTNTWRDRD